MEVAVYDMNQMPKYTYLNLVPGEEKDRLRCLVGMKKASNMNFYYSNIYAPENILKIQPIMKGELYRLEMQLTLNKESFVM